MTPYYEDTRTVLYNGDCIELLKGLSEHAIDACVCDPPYGLEFMGNDWDRLGKPDGFRLQKNPNDVQRDNVGGRLSKCAPEYTAGIRMQHWHETWAREALRVLKPGGYLLAFGGARTYHRLACAVENAGFEIRDQIMWIYGSGFPKSLNLDGDWTGFGTALKPAHEPIVAARKPLIGGVVDNVNKYGVGVLNIDACRVDSSENLNGGAYTDFGGRKSLPGDVRSESAAGMFAAKKTAVKEFVQPAGRWPANVIHDGSGEVLEFFPDAPGQLVCARTAAADQNNNVRGRLKHITYNPEPRDGEPTATKRYTDKGATNFAALPGQRRKDGATAARFFYCAKASKRERGKENNHPTVKPIALMRYLIKLVTPSKGVILDPFAGSGTTLLAAADEDFRCIGIEQSEEYCNIIVNRILDREAERC